MGGDMDRVAARLHVEMLRARMIHPDSLWTGYTIPQMFTRAILPELWEVIKAAWRGNIYGGHGVVEEMIQLAGVLLRSARELERRRGQSGVGEGTKRGQGENREC